MPRFVSLPLVLWFLKQFGSPDCLTRHFRRKEGHRPAEDDVHAQVSVQGPLLHRKQAPLLPASIAMIVTSGISVGVVRDWQQAVGNCLPARRIFNVAHKHGGRTRLPRRNRSCRLQRRRELKPPSGQLRRSHREPAR